MSSGAARGAAFPRVRLCQDPLTSRLREDSGRGREENWFSLAGGNEEKGKPLAPGIDCTCGCWLQDSGNGGELVPVRLTAENLPRNSI